MTNAEGKTLGTGFLISAGELIATCAHVVEGMEPRVAFPSGEPRPARVLATDEVHDVAILRIEGELPEGAEPARLGRSLGAYHRDFWSRGYRRLGEMEGFPAEGRVGGAVSEYPGVEYMPLILESLDIHKGMSGAPVYIPDWDLVVGMTIGYWGSLKPETRIPPSAGPAFATPSEAIAALCPDIQLEEPLPDDSRLRAAYVSAWPVFKRVRLDRFVGREWLTKKVDAFLQKEDRGYLVLEAGAGLGKTTFLAHLVQKRGYVHHFAERASGQAGIASGLWSLAAQLVQAWGLPPHLVEEVWPGTISHPDLLQDLLIEAARKRDDTRPGEKIVLVVDALDEAGTPPGQNVLGLPRVLPKGVYVIASQRPVSVRLWVERPRCVFRLEAEDEDNRNDMQVYLEEAATWEGVAQALEESGYTEKQFVTILLKKCRGVWIYLHYVVEEIERGERSPLDLDTLPEDVWQYYAQYWGRWRDREGWSETYLPLLSTLAAAQEALALSRLCTLAGMEATPGLERLLREDWRPFLTVEGARGDRRYRLYHASLREFLEGQAPLTRLEDAERSLTEELAAATSQAHRRIADRYLAAWDGLEQGLPGLQKPEKRSLDGGYGLRHLAAHLEGAGREDDLHRLLRAEWVHEEHVSYTRQGLGGWVDRQLSRRRFRLHERYENAWYVTKEAAGQTDAYLADVYRAWWLAEDAFTKSQCPVYIGLQCRYALITASLNSLAEDIPAALVVALVSKRIWSPVQALVYARQVPRPWQRAEALARLAPYLPEVLLPETVAAARAIKDEHLRVKALTGLASRLPEAFLRETLVSVQAIEGEPNRGEALAGLAPYLPASLLLQALLAARAIGSEKARVDALVGLIPRLPDPLRENVLREALVAVQELPETGPLWSPRAEALVSLAPHLMEPLQQEVVAAAKGIGNDWARARALEGLARYLPAPLRQDVLRAALTAARAIESNYWRTQALMALVPLLAESGNCQDALVAARDIENAEKRANALVESARYFPEQEQSRVVGEVLAAARGVGQADEQETVLVNLVPWVAELGYLEEALMVTSQIEDEGKRAEALATLSPYLTQTSVEEALAVARTITAKWAQVRALAGLTPYRPDVLLPEVLATARTIEGRAFQTVALVGLAPRLVELGYYQEALTVTQAIMDEEARAKELTRLVSSLPESLRGDALLEALAAARKIRIAEERADVLGALAPYMSESLLQEALKVARELPVRDGWTSSPRAEALAALAPRLPESLLIEALAAAREIGDEDDQAWTLTALAPYLSEPLLREALVAASKLPMSDREGGRSRVEALAVLASHLPEPLLREALDMVRAMENKWERAEALVRLAPYVCELLPRETLAAAWTIEDKERRVEVLVELASRLSEPLRSEALGEALAVARMIRWRWNAWRRAEALTRVGPHLADSLKGEALREALAAARMIKENEARAKTLTELIPHLAEPLRVEVFQEALAAALTIEREPTRADSPRADLLVDLASYLPEPYASPILEEAMKEVQATSSSFWLKGLASRLTELGYFQEALMAAQSIDSEMVRVEALAALASDLPEDLLSDLLDTVLRMSATGYQEKALVPLIPRIAKWSSPQEALAVVKQWQNPEAQVDALSALVPYLSESQLGEALEVVQGLPTSFRFTSLPSLRTKVITALLVRLPESVRPLVMRDELAAIRDVSDAPWSEGDRAESLAELAPHLATLPRDTLYALWQETLPILAARSRRDLLADIGALAPVIAALGGEETVTEAFRAIEDVGRWWP